jgi:hypothetical protein
LHQVAPAAVCRDADGKPCLFVIEHEAITFARFNGQIADTFLG